MQALKIKRFHGGNHMTEKTCQDKPITEIIKWFSFESCYVIFNKAGYFLITTFLC